MISDKREDGIRKIVMLSPHEYLMESSSRLSFEIARDEIEIRNKTAGMNFDYAGYPVEISGEFMVTAEFEDDEAVNRFVDSNQNDVKSVYSNPLIGPYGVVCPSQAVGDDGDVKRELNLQPLVNAGGKGTGVKIVVVDTGIDGTQINVSGGYNPIHGQAPGTSAPDHGTMVAYDALIAAPNAMIFDYALLQSRGGTWVAFLSDAIRAFSEIMIEHLQNPGPKVAVNSWGMYDSSTDTPIGDPQNYSHNPNHPFNQITSALVGSGVDVVFAAGNCGSTCPSSKCGVSNRVPGSTILGANSHPDVVSVGAVTVNDDLLGYSSEGPGCLDNEKPDISGFSHFFGSGVYSIDSGTSAACPVVGGVIAAIRSTKKGRNLSPADMKSYLRNSARNLSNGQHDFQYGWGIIDAGAAFSAIP